MSTQDLPQWKSKIDEAHRRILPFLKETPLIKAEQLSSRLGCNVWLKLENKQPSGSFKIRGAFNKTAASSEGSDTSQSTNLPPIVTASSGNHAAACAEAWSKLGRRGEIFVPTCITEKKWQTLMALDEFVKVRIQGDECCQSEAFAKQYASDNGLCYFSPYNDPDIVAGQGTCAKEILSQLLSVDALYVCVGGGGLIGGIAAYMKAVAPHVEIVGCQPSLDPVMFRSVEAGRVVTYEEAGSKPTISQATAGGVEDNSITFPLCRDLVNRWHLVEEVDIARAVQTFRREVDGLLVEPASGLSLATLEHDFAEGKLAAGRNVVLVISSGNVGEDELKNIEAIVKADR